MNTDRLLATAAQMIADYKGILAIDESQNTCKKRFDAHNVEFTEENRRLYRQLLVTAPGIEDYISGMILFDETIHQSTDEGTRFVDVLKSKGILPGIKVDMGAKDLALHSGEKVTEGLDGLRERLAEYAQLGTLFAKWRAVITIGNGIPSDACINANAHALARYAALVQEAGLVPMVEPEILLDGDHTIEKCYDVTAKTLHKLFAELQEQGVVIEGTILKVSMVLSGKACAEQADVDQVAQKSIACYRESVPESLPGIVFLSGGQSDLRATQHLNAMNDGRCGELPWRVSFSYGRGIQAPALKIWAENPANVEAAQKALLHRAKCNGYASMGKYTEEVEKTS